MSRAALVPVNLPALATPPSSPTIQTGDIYYDSTVGTVSFYNGASWVDLGASSATALIFTGFDGGSASTTVFDLTLDLGAAA